MCPNIDIYPAAKRELPHYHCVNMDIIMGKFNLESNELAYTTIQLYICKV